MYYYILDLLEKPRMPRVPLRVGLTVPSRQSVLERLAGVVPGVCGYGWVRYSLVFAETRGSAAIALGETTDVLMMGHMWLSAREPPHQVPAVHLD